MRRSALPLLLLPLLLPLAAQAQTATPTPAGIGDEQPNFTVTRTPTRTPTVRLDFFTGFEHGAPVDFFFNGDAAGSQLNGGVVTSAGFDSFDDWQYYCQSYGTGFCYVERDFTASGDVATFGTFRVDVAPPYEEKAFVRFNNGGSIAGFITINQAVTGTGYVLRMYYGNTFSECGSSLNDGTTCVPVPPQATPTNTLPAGTRTPTPKCQYQDAGEASCASGTFGESGVLGYGRHYYLSFGEQNAYEGKPGAVRLDVQVWDSSGTRVWSAAQTRPQGTCAASGPRNLWACSSDADCTDSTPCTASLVTPSSVYWGAVDNSTYGDATFYIGSFGVQTNQLSALRRARIETLVPVTGAPAVANGMTSGAGCAGQTWWGCVDELSSAAPDGDISYVAATTANAQRSFVTADLATLAAGEAVQGIAMTQVGRQSGTGSATKIMKSCIYNNATADCGTGVDWFGFGDTAYRAASYVMKPLQSTGSAWGTTSTAINAVELEIDRPTGSTGDTRTTAVIGEVLISQDYSVPVGGALSDRNADGHINVCWAGDSRLYYEEFTNALSAGANQPDILTKCARGGATTTNGLRTIDNMLNGDPVGLSGCVVKRGISGTKCDYIFLDYGVNDWAYFSAGGTASPMLKDQGYCWDNGGANEGSACTCALDFANPYISVPVPSPEDVAYFFSILYCVQGASFGQVAPPFDPCPGQGSIDYTCNFSTTNTHYKQAGCKNAAGCPTGICTRKYQISSWAENMRKLIDKIHAHSSNAKIIYVLPWNAFDNTGPANPVCWGHYNTELSAMRQFYMDMATRYSDNWIDANREFQRRCKPWTGCLIPLDGIHPSTVGINGNPSGNVVLGELAAGCLNGDSAFTNKSCTNL